LCTTHHHSLVLGNFNRNLIIGFMRQSKNVAMAVLLIAIVQSTSQPLQMAGVKLGVDVLLVDHLDLVKNKRVGLITNPSGVTSGLQATADVLFAQPDVHLVALFGPEHGVRGDVEAGQSISHFTDVQTGLPVFSLYGPTKKPTPEMLKDVDVLVYDIQDIGLRSYTFIYTMALAMQAAKENDIPFIVLDRPNPLGGEMVDGPILDPALKSFIGMYPIPNVYGLTVGELAGYFNREFNIDCDLTVIPMQGWQRWMQFQDTGQTWVPTSPHIPTAQTVFYCALTGIIGELGAINVGVGYTQPFQLLGAAWMNAYDVAAALNKLSLPGVYFRAKYYKPFYGASKDTFLQGVEIYISDPKKLRPIEGQVKILAAVMRLYPDADIFNETRNDMFDKAMGTSAVRQALEKGTAAEAIVAAWQQNLERFRRSRADYFLY
jgi:uncharacterized protein YbbC (DUF1343 family)